MTPGVAEGKDITSSAGYRRVGVREEVPQGWHDPQAGESRTRSERYHNVYIQSAAYREFVQSGQFPTFTMMVGARFGGGQNEPDYKG